MNRQKAYKDLIKYSRAIVAPKQAEKWVEAFGESLESLGINPKPTKKFYRVIPSSTEDAEKDGVAVCHLVQALVKKLTSEKPTQGIFHGVGRNSEWITSGCVEILKKNL